jgi:hypothetical protein
MICVLAYGAPRQGFGLESGLENTKYPVSARQAWILFLATPDPIFWQEIPPPKYASHYFGLGVLDWSSV